MKSREKQTWEHVKSFQDGICVVKVTMLSGYRPRYSFQIGRANEDGGVVAHYGVFVDTALGKSTLRESIADKICKLVGEAEAWILERTQVREDEIIEQRITKEKTQADFGKHAKPMGTHRKAG